MDSVVNCTAVYNCKKKELIIRTLVANNSNCAAVKLLTLCYFSVSQFVIDE